MGCRLSGDGARRSPGPTGRKRSVAAPRRVTERRRHGAGSRFRCFYSTLLADPAPGSVQSRYRTPLQPQTPTNQGKKQTAVRQPRGRGWAAAPLTLVGRRPSAEPGQALAGSSEGRGKAVRLGSSGGLCHAACPEKAGAMPSWCRMGPHALPPTMRAWGSAGTGAPGI